MDWQAILFSEPALGLYALVGMYVWNLIKAKFQWDTERWEGLVANAYMSAEKAGLKTGREKLDRALQIFGSDFVKFYGKGPSLKDLADASLDLARVALAQKGIKLPDSK